MIDTSKYFTSSLDLREHPLLKSKRKTKAEYYIALSYVVNLAIDAVSQGVNTAAKSVVPDEPAFCMNASVIKRYAQKRLELYRKTLLIREDKSAETNNDAAVLQLVSAGVTSPWRKKHRHFLICDAALILTDKTLVKQTAEIIKQNLSKRQNKAFDDFFRDLFDLSADLSRYKTEGKLMLQCRKNEAFSQQRTKRIIVTANMSAGKSTLINALVGKKVVKTSQEVCTDNISYIYSKSFDDGRAHLSAENLALEAKLSDFIQYTGKPEPALATSFLSAVPETGPVCLIDTPGVNAALYKSHSQITHRALKENNFDAVIYVVSPTNLGTDAEMKHLKWVAENISDKKIIFVLNKTDCFDRSSDNIDESVSDFRKDLMTIGFKNPTICPVSAYFGLLIKAKMSGQKLTEDEDDEYTFFSKKFRKPFFDLTRFYDGVQCSDDDTEEIRLCKQSGIYGLEKQIYGGLL